MGSPLAGSQVHARRVGIRALDWRRPASREGRDARPRTNVDTKPRPELLRTTVQRACVPRPDHGGPSEWPGRANRSRSTARLSTARFYLPRRRVSALREDGVGRRERIAIRKSSSLQTSVLERLTDVSPRLIRDTRYTTLSADRFAASSSSSSPRRSSGPVGWSRGLLPRSDRSLDPSHDPRDGISLL